MKFSLWARCTCAMVVVVFSADGLENQAQPTAKQTAPSSMTKMVVRLMGPGIKPGSFAALPKTIYLAGNQYARIEDPPDARQRIQKLTIIHGREAYSANLIDKTGTRTSEQAGAHDLYLPIILPFDPQRRLGKLDQIEFGSEADFFESEGASKRPGPMVNAKPTDAYELQTGQAKATLVLRGGTGAPVFLSWQTAEGTFRYEYITYEDLPFRAALFEKPSGIQWKQIPPDSNASSGDH